jgi:ABC-type transporter Mla maintaining outer membrane lipid asymmetry permease subunit MlaE
MVIVTTAAWQGLSTKGGAAGIGRHTTRSVVYSILWIIVVDATYTWIETVINLR